MIFMIITMPQNQTVDIKVRRVHRGRFVDLFKAPWMRWRRFDFGQLATLLMLETRLWARTSQAAQISTQILQIFSAHSVGSRQR